MRKLFPLALVLALFVGVGCDSNDDEGSSDSELFVGTWTVVNVTNDSGGANEMDLTQALVGANGTLNSLSLGFNTNNTYTLNADYRSADTPDVVVAGAPFTYTVNETTNQITLQLPSPTGSGTVPAQIGYSFNGDDEFTALLPSIVMNSLFQTTLYSGNVAARFTK